MTGLAPLDDAKARLAASSGEAGLDAVLSALAAVDSAGVARWLITHPDAAAMLAPGLLSRALSGFDDTAAAKLEAFEVVSLLAGYGHLLAPASMTDIVRSLSARGAGDRDLAEAVSAALGRAPEHPGLLRAAAERAAAAGDTAGAHDLLTRLGQADPQLPTVQRIRSLRGRLAARGHPTVRLAVLSSYTVDPLLPYLDLACRGLELDPEIHLAPFNTWDREMLGGGSALQRFDPQVTVLAVSVDDLVPALAGAPSAEELSRDGEEAVDRVLAAAARFSSWSNGVLVVHALWSAFRDPLGPAAGRNEPSRGEILARLNGRLAEGLRALPRCHLLELGDVLTRRRQGAVDNPKMRHLARMRLSEAALADVAHAIAEYVAPAAGRTRKCVVLDLDNTLWGGIVGEDGPHGIHLGDTAPGSEYREFQQYLLGLSRRGLLLAINSKNNEADALEVIRSHEAMVLREDAFSAMRINWDNKASNMLSLAQELNIGLDALVFVDDSEKERALMRQALPQVLTPEMPRDPARYRETLERLPGLQVLTVTDEDRARTRQYTERRQREHLRVSSDSLGEYLASLEIAAAIARASERTLPRVHQLFQRTNQFNLTGRRYELGALTAHAASADWRVYTIAVRDRFGDHGLVATALVQLAGEAWVIHNFVMSCRVIGYGVEDALLAHVAADASRADVRWLVGEFTATPKNAPARDFYARNAFARTDDADAIVRWRRDLVAAPMTTPPWIAVTTDDA